MDLAEYQEKAYETCTPACYCDEYLDLGYISEVGELAGKLAKRIRGDVVSDMSIMLEIGDCAWMIAIKARLHGQVLSVENTAYAGAFNRVDDLLCPSKDLHNLKFAVLMNVCEALGFDFNECLLLNLDKLADRQGRGVIRGCGDRR